MKILLDGKYVVSVDVLDQIIEVERIGSYSSNTYKIIGEPTSITVIKDTDLVHGEKAEKAEEAENLKELDQTKKKLDETNLRLARFEAIERLLKESNLSRTKLTLWAESITSSYDLRYTKVSTVREWLKVKEKES